MVGAVDVDRAGAPCWPPLDADADGRRRSRPTFSTPGRRADRLGVVDRELAWCVPPSTPGIPSVSCLAGVDTDDVGAELRELLEHVQARALADRGQQNDRGRCRSPPRASTANGPQAMAPSGSRALRRSEVDAWPSSAPDQRGDRDRAALALAGGIRTPNRACRRRATPRARVRYRPGRRRAAGKTGIGLRRSRAHRGPGLMHEPDDSAGRSTAAPPPRGRPRGSAVGARPSALSRPISWVRSETATSMTFMMPIPATVPARSRRCRRALR